jgi:hypothetical protein
MCTWPWGVGQAVRAQTLLQFDRQKQQEGTHVLALTAGRCIMPQISQDHAMVQLGRK